MVTWSRIFNIYNFESYVKAERYLKIYFDLLNSPIAIQLNRSVSKNAQHEADGGALDAIDAKQRRLVAAAHHHQVSGAACVSALQFHRLQTNNILSSDSLVRRTRFKRQKDSTLLYPFFIYHFLNAKAVK